MAGRRVEWLASDVCILLYVGHRQNGMDSSYPEKLKLSGHDNDPDPASLHCLHGSGAKLVLKVWLHHHDDSQPRLPLRCHSLRKQ